ncbi:UNVERIFIED_CONTAM: hypothetical protein PYX00_004705 [Menopon gallinae]|uniref:Clarin-3 n=1 Tax=Menopon gallinae TaxID=328185 RepID=A0AAW2I4X3_9NEOP
MNLFRKGSIFLTFFGSCLALALVVAALGTKWWVTARAKRISNPGESDGKINLGLFEGDKRLNVKYGWREHPVSVVELARKEREFLLYGAWIATIGCLAVGLLFSTLSAIFAVLNTATNQYLTLTGVPGLYLWNLLAMSFHLFAVILWAIQYIQKLQYNVLSRDDLDNRWTSSNMASLGYSFWFVVGASLVHLGNAIVVYIGTKEPRDSKNSIPIVEEKGGGAIMLY